MYENRITCLNYMYVSNILTLTKVEIPIEGTHYMNQINTQVFQPSHNIMASPTSYTAFFIIQISCTTFHMKFLHAKRMYSFSKDIRISRFSEGWTVMTETSVLSRYIKFYECYSSHYNQ